MELKKELNKENPLLDIIESGLEHDVHKWVHYLPLYHRHFKRYRKRATAENKVRVLEIGVWRGGSLDLWNQYFGKDNCELYGLDIDPSCKRFEKDNVKILIGDQSDKIFLQSIIDTTQPFDIIIDDGGHTMVQQINTFEVLYDHVKPGGVFLCEDLHTSYWSEYGGGNHGQSFVDYSKRFIDKINAYHHKFSPVDSFTQSCYGIHYYDSMIFLEKSKTIINQPRSIVWSAKTT